LNPGLAKLMLYHLSHTYSSFCSGYFGDGVSRTICLGWPQTLILPISASQVAKITCVSPSHQALYCILIFPLALSGCKYCCTFFSISSPISKVLTSFKISTDSSWLSQPFGS
jgi:hypothetical protein